MSGICFKIIQGRMGVTDETKSAELITTEAR